MLHFSRDQRFCLIAFSVLAAGTMLTSCGGGSGSSQVPPAGANIPTVTSQAQTQIQRFGHRLSATRPTANSLPPGFIDEAAAKTLLRDDSAGHPPVDPLSLHPRAIADVGNPPVFEVFKCWSVDKAPPQAPPATAIICFAPTFSAPAGDGSLSSNPNGNPDTQDAIGNCPSGFPTFDQLLQQLTVVRLYDKNKNQLERVQHFVDNGTIYNGITGKAATVFDDEVFVRIEDPIGTGNDKYVTVFGNDFGVRLNNKIIVLSSGIIVVGPSAADPTLPAALFEAGPHPYDNWLIYGDLSGLLPVCNALM